MSKRTDPSDGLSAIKLISRKPLILSLQVQGRDIILKIRAIFLIIMITSRACVGRNFAFLELQIIIASIMRRYDICLAKEDQKVVIKFILILRR